jgi:hypothetical protein
MSTQALADADIEQILDAVVCDPSFGLDYAMFLRDNPFLAGYSSASIVAEKEGPSLERRLGGAPGHPAEQQLEFGRTSLMQRQWWKKVVPQVRKEFQRIRRILQEQNEAEPMTPTRLVFDLEMGGLLCALVDENGWVFATTLGQEVMNQGHAERGLVKMVQELQGLQKNRGENSPIPPMAETRGPDEGEAS